MKKQLVSIAIPALNEGRNIKRLLLSLLAQKQESYTLLEIIVLSDGSTDNTVSESKSIKSKLIKIIDSKERKGKIERLPEIFKIYKGDILIQLDADITLGKSINIVENLVNGLIINNADLVCCLPQPLQATNYLGRVLYFGNEVWNNTLKSLGKRAERHYCIGRIRAFSRNYTRSFKFHKKIFGGEDVYTFYFAKQNRLKVAVVHNAIVYYKFPNTFKDYARQMRRYQRSETEIPNLFPIEIHNKYEVITNKEKISALIKTAYEYPFYISFSYLFLQLCMSFYSKYLFKPEKIWAVADSSKNI